jgi:hypothetical protein
MDIKRYPVQLLFTNIMTSGEELILLGINTHSAHAEAAVFDADAIADLYLSLLKYNL